MTQRVIVTTLLALCLSTSAMAQVGGAGGALPPSKQFKESPKKKPVKQKPAPASPRR